MKQVEVEVEAGLGNHILCRRVDQYIAIYNILLPEANIAMIAIRLRRILRYCNVLYSEATI